MRSRLFVAAASSVVVAIVAACVGDDPNAESSSSSSGTAPSNGTDSGSGTDSSSGSDSGTGTPPPCGNPNQACCAGNVCNGGSSCNGTICECTGGKTACGNTCVDTKTDAKHCGRCDHDCLGGTCSAADGGAAMCGAVNVATGQTNIRNIVVNGGRAYWTRSIGATTNGGVFSSKLDGTDLITVFDGGATKSCTGLAVAKTKLVATCDGTTNKDILQCTLPCAASSMTPFKTNIVNAGALAGDDATGDVFYAVGVPYNQLPQGNVFKVDATGTITTQVGTPNAQANPVALAVANGSIYWLNGSTYTSNTPQYNGGVKRALLSALGTEMDVLTTNKYFDNSALSVDANNVYFIGRDRFNNDTDLASGSANGNGAPTVFANTIGNYGVSDGTNVYFAWKGAVDNVSYCSRTAGCGGGMTVLSPNELNLSGMTVDDVSVLWGKFNGELRRIAKP